MYDNRFTNYIDGFAGNMQRKLENVVCESPFKLLKKAFVAILKDSSYEKTLVVGRMKACDTGKQIN